MQGREIEIFLWHHDPTTIGLAQFRSSRSLTVIPWLDKPKTHSTKEHKAQYQFACKFEDHYQPLVLRILQNKAYLQKIQRNWRKSFPQQKPPKLSLEMLSYSMETVTLEAKAHDDPTAATLMIACMNDSLQEHAKLVREHANTFHLLFNICIQISSVKSLQFLANQYGETLLSMAVKKGQIPRAKMLIANLGVAPNHKTLLWAIKNKDEDFIRYLVTDQKVPVYRAVNHTDLIKTARAHSLLLRMDGDRWAPNYQAISPRELNKKGTHAHYNKVILTEIHSMKDSDIKKYLLQQYRTEQKQDVETEATKHTKHVLYDKYRLGAAANKNPNETNLEDSPKIKRPSFAEEEEHLTL